MNTRPACALLLFLTVTGIAAPATAEQQQKITAWQTEILRAIREHDHLLTVVVYKRSIILSGAANKRRALQVSHAFVVKSEKGNIPEGARIFFVKPMDLLMEQNFSGKQNLIGESQLYHIIGDVHGKLQNGIDVLWDPLCFSKEQETIHTDYTILRQNHAQEIAHALKSPRTSPPFILDERAWKMFERQMQTEATQEQ